MKNCVILFIAFAIIIGISSCKCKEACTMLDWQYTLVFSGFSDSDLTTLTLKSYAKGSNFTNFRDSTLLTNLSHSGGNNDRAISLQGNDSTDYKVTIGLPHTGISYYYITNMSFQSGSCKSCAKSYMIHSLTSCSLNGGVINNLGGNISLQK